MSNKTVIITGGSRGIGRAISTRFAKEGYNIVINYVNDDNSAQNLKEILENEYNVSVLLIKADISNEDEIKKIISTTREKFNSIDVIVNNAGICYDSSINVKNKSTFLKILEVNLVAPFLICKYAEKDLISNKGCIVNIASTNGINTYYPESLDYDASKAGLINLTKNLSKYFAPNVRVNAIAPGWTDTDMVKDIDPKYRKIEEDNILLNRFAKPEEIANVVYFLASGEASYINGEIIVVDGGNNGY